MDYRAETKIIIGSKTKRNIIDGRESSSFGEHKLIISIHVQSRSELAIQVENARKNR